MKHLFSSCLLSIGLLASTVLSAQGPAYIPGDVLVMLQPGASAVGIARDLAVVEGAATGLHVVREVSAPMRAWLLHFDDTALPQWKVLAALRNHPAVQLAQNNHTVQERIVPNDAQYGQQWHHQNIDSEAAWDITTGGVTATGDTIVVAIMENADVSHADLVANAWHNFDEIPGNSIDDDGNGYVDDYRGWNTPNGDDDVYSGGHGTQCAGMVGATGNNGVGVVGANWKVKLMPVNYGGVGEADVVEAYTYPLVMRRLYNSTNGDLGAFVVATSASWGIDGGQPGDSPLWCAIYDTLGTAGVLNCGATANNAVNIDQVGDLPTACPSDFMISVTATNTADQRTFSAWGLTTIDLGAPGEDVRTTSIGGGYGNTSGTSFACPLTAGVIALLYSAPCGTMMALVHSDPSEGALYVRQKLFEGVEQVGNLPGNTVTGGRVSSGNSMQLIMNGCGTCPVPFGAAVTSAVSGEATYSWTALSPGPFNVRYREVGSPTWVDVMGIAASPFEATGLTPCVTYEFQVEVVCVGETSGYSQSTLLAPPAEGVPTIALSGYPDFCAGEVFTLTSSAPANNEWSNGETTQSISIDQSGSYSVTLNGACGTYTSEVVDLTVLTPVPPAANDVFLPGPGAADLVATGDNITWYDAAVGGTAVGTGNNWQTPFLNSTTDFWCTSSVTNGVVPTYGGQTDRINTAAPGQYHDNGTNYEFFTANVAFPIVSVKVYANGAGNRTIGLVTVPGGTTVVQGTFNIPDGESRVQLDFQVPGPGQYGLRIMNGDPQLWRDGNGSNPAYPYALGTLGSITSSSVAGANATEYYYFFYDWEVGERSVACESERVNVTVEMPTGITDAGTNGTTITAYPQPVDRDLFFDVTGTLATERLLISVLDNSGRVVGTKTTEGGRATVSTAFLADGMYTYRMTRDDQEVSYGKFIVAHLR
ncbi:MAG: S8 family serine peptidase [Flavobacteriales bacterium]